ncbi:alpha-ketoacid dehydrogenase kinase [Gonapodya prolifera JEL478]|uniref:Protein-serine/threonine kinase n=1 Tax=Gonapodya prolifera (strain JEL478) TaxID=1344416 RepID=A0A139A3D6_GONPJ|nr:alpha-ketoacid dehydrogenase kinase [Gonapodya prolifera JEL478]|eukprot:KXS11179.1 alpha-ketoacid dehydrogenase kinase [Gonapodya prolifera JEL478]
MSTAQTSASTAWSPALKEKIDEYASKHPTMVPLKDMVKFGPNPTQGTLLNASEFLGEEIPIRLASRIRLLERLPVPGLAEMEEMKTVVGWYARSFQDLVLFNEEEIPSLAFGTPLNSSPSTSSESVPTGGGVWSRWAKGRGFCTLTSVPSHHRRRVAEVQRASFHASLRNPYNENPYYLPLTTNNTPRYAEALNKRFATLLTAYRTRHDPISQVLASALLRLPDSLPEVDILSDNVQQYLDSYHLAALGNRMLTTQHLELLRNAFDGGKQRMGKGSERMVGIVDPAMDVGDVVKVAVDDARSVARDYFGGEEPPRVVVEVGTQSRILGVPGHVRMIVFEVLKNSIRAVMENTVEGEPFEDISVGVEELGEFIVVTISDRGGGIPSEYVDKVFKYAFTTAPPLLDPTTDLNERPPLAGYGYGLPLSRLYARYFHGDLSVKTQEGEGTVVKIQLRSNLAGMNKEYMGINL